MKNITKKKIVLVTLSFLLGFSIPIFTNYQGNLKNDNQPTLKTPNLSQGTEIYTIAQISDHLWSPDGTKIAYIKSPSGEMWNCELWVADKNPLDAELINHVLISSEAEYDGLLDWKDDWILFRIRREEGTPSSYYGRNELWRIRYDGTGMAQVTFTNTNGIRTTWSNPAYDNRGTAGWGRFIPGTDLVYFHAHDGNGWPRTFVCNANGTDSWYHISNPDYTWRPALSPTGNKLLWGQQSNFGLPTTHKSCNVDGSGRTTIKAFTNVISVTVLADGNTVIWSNNDNIYAIDMDGTNERTVLDDVYINRQWNYNPSDGQGLIMGSDRLDGNMHIYKINVDSTGIEQLTEGPYLDEFPILSLDGQYLSYLRLPYDFDKGSSTIPYPYELVVKDLYPVSTVGFFDDFENGLSKWQSITGLWHLTDTGSAWPDPCHSPTHAMWFGIESTGNFETGFWEYGELVSIPFSLVDLDIASLEFYHWRMGEGGSYDGSYVYISIDGINWDLLYQSSSAYIAPWEQISLDISGYVDNPSVQLRFYFDTLDNIDNDYRGWLVDDIQVIGYILDHEISVSLDTPVNPQIGNAYLINATVNNNGLNDEYDVDLLLYLDDVIVDSIPISSLPVGASETINYMWTPTEYRTYNFTAYAPPVPGESLIDNNIKTKLVTISFATVAILNAIEEPAYFFGGLANNYQSIYDGLIAAGKDTIIITNADILSGALSGVNVLILIDNVPNDAASIVVKDWAFNGGDVISFDSSICFLNWAGLLPPEAEGTNGYETYWDYNSPSQGKVVNDAHPVMSGYSYGADIYGAIGDAQYYSDVIMSTSAGPYYEPLVKTDIGTNLDLVVALDAPYSGRVVQIWDYAHWNTVTNQLMILNAIEWVASVILDHDLSVSLEVPSGPDIGDSYLINATVTNTGLNDESDVDLLLYLDDIIVESITISSLPVGASETISYMWIPLDYGTYNFTAYAPPVTDESYLDNNRKTTIAHVSETQLFDGLYIKHTFSQMGYVYNTNFTYTPYTSSLYNVTFGMEYLGTHMSYTWIVDALTRIMSGGSVFGDGAHTPGWIFTDVSLGDEILIAADGEGDHLFNVSNELIYDLPGFGLIEVWELEDLTPPGGVVWYEKSTGILLNGTFFYSGGTYNYTFDFIDTNVEFISFTFTTPDSTSSWETGTSQDITWTSIGSISDVKIELYKSGVFEREIIATTTNDGTYNWDIPTDLDDGIDYQIKISDVANPPTNDFSDTFEIFTPVVADTITVTNPDSLTVWEMGTSQDITWTSTGTISDVKIELYKGGVFEREIIASTTNDGTYNWDIPTDLEDGIDYQIKISDVSNLATYDESSNFAITSVDIPPAIPSYNLYIVIGIICVVSVILFKKRFKLIK